ncbi:MAG: AAA family ATPase, partial [Actinobacteria bacterium]|nr:AAA family ATPase [Actinomycetota bacterium]
MTERPLIASLVRGGLPLGVQIGLLGPLEVATVGGRRVQVPGAKERCLLAVLAVDANREVTQDRLVEALWGGDPPRTARRTLQGLVSRVRAVLASAAADGPAGSDGAASIEATSGGWMLRAGARVVDLSAAASLAEAGRAAMAAGDPARAAGLLADALNLWRGEPLAEFGGAAWSEPIASRLDELRRELTEERMAAELACGRHGPLVAELDVACRRAPLRERLWELRMLALYRAGRQADALRAFQELRDNLVDQLGIEPNPALARLERAILAQDPALDWVRTGPDAGVASGSAAAAAGVADPPPVWAEGGARPVPAALAEWRGSTFVGRDAELAELDTVWHRARRGVRQAVFVAGEPGIGKTALVARVAEAAWAAGAMVLFGRSDEDSVVAFQPWVEMLTHYVEATPPAELRRHLGAHAGDLALLVPELARRLPELSGVAGTGAEHERYRILDAVGAALAAMAGCVPVVVVLDDLHWADRPTLQVLQHVIRRTANLPLLLLGTYRDTDLVRTHPMAAVLADLRRADLVQRLSLRGLQTADVVALLTGGQPGGPADEALAAALWEETEGNPLFLRESLRHLAETGAIAADAAGRWRAQRRITQLGIPEGVREVIGRRLTLLSETANIALRAGSVQGREIRLDVLAAVTDVGEDALLDALEEATAAGVVTEAPGRPGRWSFTHALVRQALYGELTVTRRVRLHQRVGAALARLDGDGDGPQLAELAHHFTQAAVGGEAERAVEYGRRAGAYALKAAAFEEAARHFALALEVAEDAELEIGVRADLLLAHGDAQWRSGDARLARKTFERVVPLVVDIDPERLARAAIGYAGAYARILWADIGIVEHRAVELLDLALARLNEADSPLRALALAALAQALYFDAATSERRPALSDEALAMARRLGDPAVLGRVLCSRNLAVWAPAFSAELAANSTEARAIGRSLGDRELEASACLHGFIGLFGTGEVAGSRAWLDDFGRLAAELKAPLALSLHEILTGNLDICEGRFAEGERRLLNAFHRSQEARDPDAFMMYVVGMGILRLLQGRVGEMRGSL